MLAGLLNITIEQGATFSLILNYEDENGLPINLTGMTARMQLRRQTNTMIILLGLTTEDNSIVITPETGEIAIFIDAGDTATLTGSGQYDLELINGPVVNRLLEGTFKICNEVTK